MPCYWPLRGYIGPKRDDNKVNIVWKRTQSNKGETLYVPCGQCIGCRLERSRQWAIRCVKEASLYDDNCFLTLTYKDEKLPKDGSLKLEHWQLFFKRLRKRYGNEIRYFHCGEYGEKFQRPHYHAIVFNHDFKDKELFSNNEGNKIYTSKELESLWDHGYATIGDVNFKSASYVARYCLKKVSGEKKEDHYKGRKPEYTTMSRRPGIGSKWYDKYKSDVFPSDYMIVNGVKCKPPKFFDYLLDKENSKMFDAVKYERRRRFDDVNIAMDNDSFRLPVKEEVKLAEMKKLKRNYEEVG